MKQLIIFDFDGVIADSETLSNTVLAEAITELEPDNKRCPIKKPGRAQGEARPDDRGLKAPSGKGQGAWRRR